MPTRSLLAVTLATALAGLSTAACDPGTECTPLPEAAPPPGVDPCDPSTYPAPDTASPDATDADAGTVDADSDVADATYPAGPFGTRVGDTVANRTFSMAGGGTLSFGDLYADPRVTLVFVSTAAGWCSACREEQPTLVALHEEFADDGLAILVAVFEDVQGNPATEPYARAWRDQYGLPFPALVDDRNQFAAYYDASLAPLNLFVDGHTMEIVGKSVGFDEAGVRALIAQYL